MNVFRECGGTKPCLTRILIASFVAIVSLTAVSQPVSASHWCAPSTITYSPVFGYVGTTVTFSFTLHNNIADALTVDDFYLTFSWDSTTWDLGAATVPGYGSHTFSKTEVLPSSAGSDSLSLSVYGIAGGDFSHTTCDYGSASFNVYSLPSVNAMASPSSGNVPLAVTFSASASGGISPYTYSWTFGDGASGSGATVTHTYTSPNAYTAQVTAADSGSMIATATLTVTVTAPPLQLSISANPTSGVAPLDVTFTSTVTGGFGSYTYAWTFGDGGTSTVANPTHVYTAAGSFTSTLVVTDSQSTQKSSTTTVTVVAALSAVVSSDSTTGMIPYTVSFTASASGGTGPYAYHWDFGDGATSSLQNPSHTYQVAGTYAVTLTVTDSGGQTATKTITVTANSSPIYGSGTGIPPWIVYVIVVLVVIAAAVGFVVNRRRKTRSAPPRQTQPPGRPPP